MLEQIKEVLSAFGMTVYYGMAEMVDGAAQWSYIVFNRDTLAWSENRTGYTDYIRVAIVQDAYIEDGLAEQIVAAMESIPGIRRASGPGQYEYTRKPKTDAVVEMLVIPFIRARK